jgi:ketosteroid isomerase-like protein
MIGAMIVKRMVRSAYEMVNRGDLDSMMAGWADDAIYDSASELGVGVTIKGKKSIEEWHRRYFEEFPKREFILKSICFQEAFPLLSTLLGSCVIMVDWSITETNKAGKEFRYKGGSVFHMRRRKAVYVADYISMVGLPQLSTLTKPTGKALVEGGVESMAIRTKAAKPKVAAKAIKAKAKKSKK